MSLRVHSYLTRVPLGTGDGIYCCVPHFITSHRHGGAGTVPGCRQRRPAARRFVAQWALRALFSRGGGPLCVAPMPVPRAGMAMGMRGSGGVRRGPGPAAAAKTCGFEVPAGRRRPYGGAGTFASGTCRAQSTGCWPGTGRLHTDVF